MRKRHADCAGVLLFLLCAPLVVYRVCSGASVTVLASIMLGAALADLVSGLAHWTLDTWGSARTPLLGALIQSFRAHHADPQSITRHDWIETNGDNMLAVTPLLLACILWPAVACAWFASGALLLGVANQIHQWSHQARPMRAVRLLQCAHLILPREAHRVHHRAPHDQHYCIVTGWCNAPLDRIGFWRALEAAVTCCTGAQPRANL